MTITAYYHPGYAAPIGDHVMPITKFSLVADGLRDDPRVRLEEPAPLTETDLLRVHTREYIDAVRTGEPRALAESQKFPWSPQLYPSVLLTGGGCLAAARRALGDGIAAAVVSGFHHAHAGHGEGFCTFNGLVVAIDALRAAGAVQRVAVLDMDLHYGNGTAALAPARPYLFNMSIYGNDYFQNEAFRDVMAFESARAGEHYGRARFLLAEEDRAALAPAEAMRLIYEQLLRRKTKSLRCQQIDFGMGLAVANVFCRQDEFEPWSERKSPEDVFDEPPPAAGGNRLGYPPRFECGQEIQEARHRFQPLVEERGKDLVRFQGQLLHRIAEQVVVDHQLQGDAPRPAHHLVEQVAVEILAAAAKHLAADMLVKLLGIEHQAVEIEHDGPQRYGGLHSKSVAGRSLRIQPN